MKFCLHSILPYLGMVCSKQRQRTVYRSLSFYLQIVTFLNNVTENRISLLPINMENQSVHHQQVLRVAKNNSASFSIWIFLKQGLPFLNWGLSRDPTCLDPGQPAAPAPWTLLFYKGEGKRTVGPARDAPVTQTKNQIPANRLRDPCVHGCR